MSLLEQFFSAIRNLFYPSKKHPKSSRRSADRRKSPSKPIRPSGIVKNKPRNIRKVRKKSSPAPNPSRESTQKVKKKKKFVGSKDNPPQIKTGAHPTTGRASQKKKKVVKKKTRVRPQKEIKKKISTQGRQRSSRGRKNVLSGVPSTPKRNSQNKGADRDVYIGEITHYFDRIKVVVLKVVKGPVRLGDEIRVRGKKTDFKQKITSLQIESLDVKLAQTGKLVGLKLEQTACVGDKIFKLMKKR